MRCLDWPENRGRSMGKKARKRAKAEKRKEWKQERKRGRKARATLRREYANALEEVLAARAGLQRALSKLRLAESHAYMVDSGGRVVSGRLDRYHVELRDLLDGLADDTTELRLYTHGHFDGDTVAHWRIRADAGRLVDIQFAESDRGEYGHLYDPLVPHAMFELSVACAEEKLAMAKAGTPVEEIVDKSFKHGMYGRAGCPTGEHAAADISQWERKINNKKWRKKAARKMSEREMLNGDMAA